MTPKTSETSNQIAEDIGGYNLPSQGIEDWHIPLNENWMWIEQDLNALATELGVSVQGGLNQPTQGDSDWDVPINENFTTIEQDVATLSQAVGGVVSPFYPTITQGTESWHVPMNDNFTSIENDLLAIEAEIGTNGGDGGDGGGSDATVLEDHETGTITDLYGGATGAWDILSDGSLEGARLISPNTAGTAVGHLNTTLSRGSRYAAEFWPTTQGRMAFLWGVQDPTAPLNGCYAANVVVGNNAIQIDRWDNGAVTPLAEVSTPTLDSSTLYSPTITWDPVGVADNLTVELRDINNTTLATVAATDDTYSGGSFGFYARQNTGDFYDYVVQLPYSTVSSGTLEDHESGTVADMYSGSTGGWAVISSTNLEGSQVIQPTAPDSPIGHSTATMGRGNVYACDIWPDTQGQMSFLFGVQDPANPLSGCYEAKFIIGNNILELHRWDNGTQTEIGQSVTSQLVAGVNYTPEITYAATGSSLQVDLFEGTTSMGSVAGTDDTYSGGTFGWWAEFGGLHLFDYVRRL